MRVKDYSPPLLLHCSYSGLVISHLYDLSILSLQMRALGGLLKYLDKHRVGVELEDEAVKVPILALTVFSL